MTKVGLTITLTILHNAHVTGRCTLRLVVLTDKPSYSIVKFLAVSPATFPDIYYGGKLATT